MNPILSHFSCYHTEKEWDMPNISFPFWQMTRFKQKTILTYWCLPALSISNYWTLTIKHDLENKRPCSFGDQCPERYHVLNFFTSYKRNRAMEGRWGWLYVRVTILPVLPHVLEGTVGVFTVCVDEVYWAVFVIQIVCQ